MPLPGGCAEELRLPAGVQGWVLGPNSSSAGSEKWRRCQPGVVTSNWQCHRPPCAFKSFSGGSQCAAHCFQHLLLSHRAAPLQKRGIDGSHLPGSRATGVGLRRSRGLEKVRQGSPREDARHGPLGAAFCLGVSSDALRPESGSSQLSSRIRPPSPRPSTHPPSWARGSIVFLLQVGLKIWDFRHQRSCAFG